MPIHICVPRQMVYYQLGAAGAGRHTGYCWEPGGTHSTVGFPQDHTPAMCKDFTPEYTPELINRLPDLVKRFGLFVCV